MPDANYRLKTGTCLEIVYKSEHTANPTLFEVVYTKNDGTSILLVRCEGNDSVDESLPQILFDEPQVGTLSIKAIFNDPVASVICSVHASPSVATRIFWSPGRVDGQPVPSPGNPVTRAANIQITVQ